MYGYVKNIKNLLPDHEIKPVGDIEVVSDVHIKLTPTGDSQEGSEKNEEFKSWERDERRILVKKAKLTESKVSLNTVRTIRSKNKSSLSDEQYVKAMKALEYNSSSEEISIASSNDSIY